MKRRERADLPAHRKSHLAVGMYVYEADAPIGVAPPRIRTRHRARR